MEKEHIGVSIAKSLDTHAAIAEWRIDPLAYIENAGFSLSSLDDQSKGVFRDYLTHTEIRLLSLKWCFGCKMAVGGTFAALSAALVAFVSGLVVVS